MESPHPGIAAHQHAASAEAAPDHDRHVEQHNQPLARVPSAGAVGHLGSDGQKPERVQPHGRSSASDPAAQTQAGGLNVDMTSPQHQQEALLPVAAGATYPADMPDEVAPSFSTRPRASADEFSTEALTPLMVPHAQARIQAQHDTTSPWLAVVKDTPQSAAATPWSRVKDTPSSEVTPLQRGVLPHGLWLGLHQPSASKAPSMPVQSSVQTTNPALQQRHVSGAVTSGLDQLHPHGRSQEQFHASPPAPELTLRLSLSDGSSTKSNKAGQPSPSRGGWVPQPHTTPLPTHLAPRLQPEPPLETVPAVSNSAAHGELSCVLLPAQTSLQASQPALSPLPEGQLQDAQLQLHHPAAATNSCCQYQAATCGTSAPSAAAATAAAAVATAVAPALAAAVAEAAAATVEPTLAAATLTDGTHPVTEGGHLPLDARGGMEEPPRELAADQDLFTNAEPITSHIVQGQHSRNEASTGEAAGYADPGSADHQADHAHGGNDPPESGHAASADSGPDGDTPDDPDPDSNEGPSVADEVVPHRYKHRAPTQVSHARQSCILCSQASS